MDIKAKLRPFYVAKMLYEQTDEDHYLTIAQIVDQLERDYDISSSRGTIGDDIKVLQMLGVDITVEPSTQNRYYLVGRKFDLPEIKTLIDAVESARFIPQKRALCLLISLVCAQAVRTLHHLSEMLPSKTELKPTMKKSTISWKP